MRIVQSRRNVVALASEARTATHQSAAFEVGAGDNISVFVDATAVTGVSPSMTVNVEWSHDGSTWFAAQPADNFTAITAASKVVKNFAVKGLYARLNNTVSGTTPSFTFSATVVIGS